MRRGMHDLKVWPAVEADEQTPGKSSSGEDQMSLLAKVRIATSLQYMLNITGP